MDLGILMKKMISLYAVIYGGSMFGTLVFCTIFYPDETFGLGYFTWMLVYALLGDLTMLVFYSRKELTEKQLLVRQTVQILLLEIVLLTAAYQAGMFQGVMEGAVLLLVILGVYMMVRFIGFRKDLQLAKQLNARLQERKKEHKNGK
ncbi:DUF3021 family protein [Kineothrix alysoides]|uniref:DUF3021 family protein n=1 Tax=Kineothrix alysoides TaxID=1469948 RepID=A0A4V2QC74_9FIRM|nr:DUF3021 family protein [Kineothrix alysoides]TCL59047.1 DUF3021 family protein [Kineothrix alysoides]